MHESIYSYWFTSSWIHAEITLKSICGYLDRSVGSCNTLNDLPNKVMWCKQNRGFKSNRFQRDYRNKGIEDINKAYIMQM